MIRLESQPPDLYHPAHFFSFFFFSSSLFPSFLLRLLSGYFFFYHHFSWVWASHIRPSPLTVPCSSSSIHLPQTTRFPPPPASANANHPTILKETSVSAPFSHRHRAILFYFIFKKKPFSRRDASLPCSTPRPSCQRPGHWLGCGSVQIWSASSRKPTFSSQTSKPQWVRSWARTRRPWLCG